MKYNISWWNLENLLLPQTAKRSSKLKKRHKKTLKYWTDERYQQKLYNLAQVICQFHQHQGPDILAIGEVDSAEAMHDLSQQLANLGLYYHSHLADSADPRRMHVGVLYRPELFSITQQESLFVPASKKTRDILNIQFQTLQGDLLHLLINHWPSKRNNPSDRIKAAHCLKTALSHCTEPALIVGDFNTQPSDALFKDLVTDCELTPLFHLPAEPTYFHHSPTGTTPISLDFAFTSKEFSNNPHWQASTLTIEKQHQNTLERPQAFMQSNLKEFNDDGASDHFAISLTLNKTS
ncbi:Endonuclease/Exonuclease/phosphatase family protein [Piscirickettsia salmonis]|uniref:Endonuclease/Exonuclease/phosphatase family protein n=1 Tax=Piscirickettsia salmonis TaxID=1238 RepID=A0A1L6TBE7_PISSA|nr:endonuclease/exonuclease/phosphatase family protein [Piscirickettsia salmonis]AKP73840.1 nuclease [Piscirickettsia salmonis LF-89 = ATCC VR-1361]ALB22653.1 endonuclease/Exonuclease/phosphatase family protein [Piscirickettsia salmonis]ALY02664.1 nuclease [Piscirickettsia salmonis]AMA42208.1 nuclease [Piscirickettsia salmonis]AOS34683.1 nuclease [Piscirickettsia salmonis]